jgi:hypothetical protein
MLDNFEHFFDEDGVEDISIVQQSTRTATIAELEVVEDGWFLSDDTAEDDDDVSIRLRYRAVYYYRKHEWASALDEYIRLLSCKLTSAHRFELLDATIRCALKCGNDVLAVDLLNQMFASILSVNQQFQYWHIAKDVYRQLGSIARWQHMLILAIDDNENNAHYWLELSLTSTEPKFMIGCSIRAYELLKRIARSDSMKCINQRLLADLESKIDAFDDRAMCDEARIHMCDGMLPSTVPDDKLDTEVAEQQLRILSTDDEREVIERFHRRYEWLFS